MDDAEITEREPLLREEVDSIPVYPVCQQVDEIDAGLKVVIDHTPHQG